MVDRFPPRVTSGDIVGPDDASQVPRFAGPATFARLPRIDEVSRADVAADLVEVAPAYDHAEVTGIAARTWHTSCCPS